MRQFTTDIQITYTTGKYGTTDTGPHIFIAQVLDDLVGFPGVDKFSYDNVVEITPPPITPTYKYYTYRHTHKDGGHMLALFTHRVDGNIMESVEVTTRDMSGHVCHVGALSSYLPFDTTNPRRLCEVTMIAHRLAYKELDSFHAGIFHLAESIVKSGQFMEGSDA